MNSVWDAWVAAGHAPARRRSRPSSRRRPIPSRSPASPPTSSLGLLYWMPPNSTFQQHPALQRRSPAARVVETRWKGAKKAASTASSPSTTSAFPASRGSAPPQGPPAAVGGDQRPAFGKPRYAPPVDHRLAPSPSSAPAACTSTISQGGDQTNDGYRQPAGNSPISWSELEVELLNWSTGAADRAVSAPAQPPTGPHRSRRRCRHARGVPRAAYDNLPPAPSPAAPPPTWSPQVIEAQDLRRRPPPPWSDADASHDACWLACNYTRSTWAAMSCWCASPPRVRPLLMPRSSLAMADSACTPGMGVEKKSTRPATSST